MKPQIKQEEKIISLQHLIVRPTKILSRDDKNWVQFRKKNFKNFLNVIILVSYFKKANKDSTDFKQLKITLKIKIFKQVVNNFGIVKNVDFH